MHEINGKFSGTGRQRIERSMGQVMVLVNFRENNFEGLLELGEIIMGAEVRIL